MTSIKDLQNRQSNRKMSFPEMLEKFKGEIQKALPAHLDADRMVRIARTAYRLNRKLEECDPSSVFAAVIQSSQLGLEPNTMGRSFLVPYMNKKTGSMECQFIPGWMGLVELMNRTKRASISTRAVFDGDDFDYQYGDSPYVHHREGDEIDTQKITHAYAIGKIVDIKDPIIEVWSAAKIRAHRDRYNKVGGRHYSFENWEMYCRKVVLLQVLKYLPASANLDTALALNDAAEIGKQGLTVKDAIEGTWMPARDDESAQTLQQTEDKQETEQDGFVAIDQVTGGEPQKDSDVWPKRLSDRETGEVTWQDSAQSFFNPDRHALGPNGEPSMRRDGTFRAKTRRTSKKVQPRRSGPLKPDLQKKGDAPQQAELPKDDEELEEWE